MPRITQSELAQRLGVSQQAVSFALNNSGTLAEATRQRILDEAARLGYRPNAAARSMLKGRMGNAALLCNEGFSSFMPQALISGVHAALNDKGHHLILHHISEEQLSKPGYIPDIMRELAVDGFIILYEGPAEIRIREILNAFNIPAVWVNRKESVNCVYPDDFFLGDAGAAYLLERGHRRALYMGPERTNESHYSVGDRLAGFRQRFEAGGGAPFLVSGRRQRTDAESIIQLIQDEGITACLTYGPEDAGFLVLNALQRGLRVPEDFSILSISEPRPTIGHIELSIVRLPFYWIGKEAVQLLEERIAGQNREVPSRSVQVLQIDPGQTFA